MLAFITHTASNSVARVISPMEGKRGRDADVPIARILAEGKGRAGLRELHTRVRAHLDDG